VNIQTCCTPASDWDWSCIKYSNIKYKYKYMYTGFVASTGHLCNYKQ